MAGCSGEAVLHPGIFAFSQIRIRQHLLSIIGPVGYPAFRLLGSGRQGARSIGCLTR